MALGIAAMASYLPGFAVPAAAPSRGVLAPPLCRHILSPTETAAEVIARTAADALAQAGWGPSDVDILITNVLMPDHPITGSGAAAAAELGARPGWIIDQHNGGCASFVTMIDLADALVASGRGTKAIVANVQNTTGTIYRQPETRRHPGSDYPGDGCAVALLSEDGPARLLGTVIVNDPESSADMGLHVTGERRYWEAGEGELNVYFPPERAKEILARGNRAVPDAVERLASRLGIVGEDIDLLITSQPNRIYLENWRRALRVTPERHLDTFDRFGNLYGASIPVSLATAVAEGRVASGDLVVCAGFAHAGDLSGAMAIEWGETTSSADSWLR